MAPKHSSSTELFPTAQTVPVRLPVGQRGKISLSTRVSGSLVLLWEQQSGCYEVPRSRREAFWETRVETFHDVGVTISHADLCLLKQGAGGKLAFWIFHVLCCRLFLQAKGLLSKNWSSLSSHPRWGRSFVEAKGLLSETWSS